MPRAYKNDLAMVAVQFTSNMLRRTLVPLALLALAASLADSRVAADPVRPADCARDDRGCRYSRLKPSEKNSEGSQTWPADEDRRTESGSSAVKLKVDGTGKGKDFRGAFIGRIGEQRESGRRMENGKIGRRYFESYQTATETSLESVGKARKGRMELIRNVGGVIETDRLNVGMNSTGSRMSRNIGGLSKGHGRRGGEGANVRSSRLTFNLGRIMKGVQRYFNESDFARQSAGGNGTGLTGGFFDGLQPNSTEVSARKKKGKGYGKILLYMFAAMKALMLYAMVHAIGAVAGKALIVAKVALAVAVAVALKKSSEHTDKTSYEIVKHPQHSYVQTHSSSVDYDHHGYGESGYGSNRRHRRRRRR